MNQKQYFLLALFVAIAIFILGLEIKNSSNELVQQRKGLPSLIIAGEPGV